MIKETLVKWGPTIIAFIGGVGVGGLSVYLKMRDDVEKVTAEYEIEIAEVYSANKDLRREINEIGRQNKIDIAKAFTQSLGYSELEDDEDDEDDEDEFEDDPSDDLLDHERPPTVISKAVFDEPSMYEKVTLQYYARDDTLADEDGTIDNVEFVVGSHSLTRFGGISGDPNIVYVRNYRMEVDYEVVRDKRSYIEAVIGFEDRNDKPRLRKMRNGDND